MNMDKSYCVQTLFLIWAVFFISGCTTLSEYRATDSIKVLSATEGAEIFYKDKLLGHTPKFVEIPRSMFATEIMVRDGQEEKRHEIFSNYRWRDSFFSNFVFLAGMSYGWLIDWSYGSAFDMEPKSSGLVDGDLKKSGLELTSPTVRKIVIAPPQGVDGALAREVGLHIERKILKKYRREQVESFEKSSSIFVGLGVDNYGSGSVFDRDRALARLDATHLLKSQVRIEENQVVIEVHIVDAFYGRQVESWQQKVPKLEFSAYREQRFVNQWRENIFWVPNTVSLDVSGSLSTIEVDGVKYQAERSTEDGGAARLLSVVSSFGLRYFSPPTKRRTWKFKFIWVPTLSGSFGKQTYQQAAGIENLSIRSRRLFVGYGPEIQMNSLWGRIYVNLVPGLGWEELSYEESGKSHRFEQFDIGLSLELGYIYFINSNWSLRLSQRVLSSNTKLWNDLMSSRPGDHEVNEVGVSTGGASIGFTMPLTEILN